MLPMVRPVAVWLLLALLPLASSFAGWIDPDTKQTHKTTHSLTNNLEYQLVMSDEFNRDGRSFTDSHDPMWTALDKSDDDQTSTGQMSLQYYNSSNIYTKDGYLHIVTTTEDTHFRAYHAYDKKYVTLSRHFKSGMLQGWNKFCFSGGILEFSAKLPGKGSVGGLWPAAWMLGNLGRATYEPTTNNMWPFSYKKCDREKQRAQLISGCDETEHFDLLKGQGRGATEIDIIEIMPGEGGRLPLVKAHVERPYAAMTLQVAPGIPESKRPFSSTLPEWGFSWYENLTYGVNVSINPFFYGNYLGPTKAKEPVRRSKAESYQCDSIGAMASLNQSYWNEMHKYRLEWEPGEGGYLRWYIDGEFKFGIEQSSLTAAMDTQIPQEPSYLIFNTAVSTSWGFPTPPPGCTKYDCKSVDGRCGMNPGFCHELPASFLIDNVRVYQYKQPLDNSTKVKGVPTFQHTVGCNPRSHPTKKFIQANAHKYKNLHDKLPLKEVVTGTGECGRGKRRHQRKHHNELETEVEECGEGHCVRGSCVCKEGWQGPHCLVPTYKNDFPDWDREDHWVPPVAPPVVPSFLTWAGALLCVGFISALVVTTRERKRQSDQKRR